MHGFIGDGDWVEIDQRELKRRGAVLSKLRNLTWDGEVKASYPFFIV
jgi:hypothetical protein